MSLFSESIWERGGVRNVGELIVARATADPDREYLVFQDRRFSLADMERRSWQVGHGFSTCGLKKGDSVAVLMGNRPEFIFVWWALLRIGAVMVPINPSLGTDESAYIVHHCQARAVVFDTAVVPEHIALQEKCPGVDSWISLDDNATGPTIAAFFDLADDLPDVDVPISPADMALVLYTSGTTGFPKGVIHTHGDYLLTAESFARTVGLTPDDRLMTANPLFHVNAQFYSCMGTLFAGATFILEERFSASRWWSWTRHYRANKVVLLLALTTILFNRPPMPDDADHPVEWVVAGGVPPGCCAAFQTRFGVRLQTLYSLTEAPLAIMSRRTRCRESRVGLPMLVGGEGRNAVRIVGERLEELPRGAVGEIVIRNPAVMKGYLDDPGATAEAVVDGWLRTGDRGMMDDDGWIRFLGRAKDVIRKKGENISAVQVEQVLTRHSRVAEAAVIGVRPADAAGEEEVMAFVVPDGERPIAWSDLIAHCQDQMAAFKVPRFWKLLPQLPKNAMDRVVKKRLGEDGPPERSPGVFDRQET